MERNTVFLIAGGPSYDQELLTRDLKLTLRSAGKENPAVACVGTANRDNADFFQRMKRSLLDAGAKEVLLTPIVGESADLDAAKRILSDADVIFLTGGEVEDGIQGLKTTGLDTLLTELFHDGRQFVGISAGSIMMGQHWVHWDVEGNDDTASLFDCLGFVPMTFDAHGEAEDWRELKCALGLLGFGSRGYGLSSGGFFCADSEGNLRSFRNDPKIFYNSKGQVEGANDNACNG